MGILEKEVVGVFCLLVCLFWLLHVGEEVVGVFLAFVLFWPLCVACGILIPRPGIEHVPPSVEAQSLNHWTAREVLGSGCLKDKHGERICCQVPMGQQMFTRR